MDFLAAARSACLATNSATLYWMLARPPLRGAFLDTKVNSLTLQDYGAEDGIRGPDYIYGWIQGRGLEALATHAAFFDNELPPLSEKLDVVGKRLYERLVALQRQDGHAYFCYDVTDTPIYAEGNFTVHRQVPAGDIYTYSDAFFAKGLIAAASRYGLDGLGDHLAYFDRVIEAIQDNRFQMDERRPLASGSLEDQPEDYGPRMILLGAAGMLKRLGHAAHLAYADRFIEHVLTHHYDAASGLLCNVPGEDSCNVGHAIEFVGFALDYLGHDADPALISKLKGILASSFRSGFTGEGISLVISIDSGASLSPYCPWWSLPETIRAAALVYERTADDEALDIWQAAHAAFFRHYWRGTPPLAYQTITREGPTDFVPATPDLDPGYHTGLSFLAAIQVADRLKAPSIQFNTASR